MAIFHLSAKIISRSTGRSCTGAAAYRAGERIHDPRSGLTFDYRRRRYVAHKEILLPAGAPAWAKTRESLWQNVEAFEKRKDAQLCREIEVALPHELSRREQIALIQGFLQSAMVARGMVCDLAVHQNPQNVHAHVLITMRELGPDGFGGKCRAWNQRELLDSWREDWSAAVNDALARHGLDARVDHRSLEAQEAANITKENVMTTEMTATEEIGTPTSEPGHFKAVGLTLQRSTWEMVASPEESMPVELFAFDGALEQFREMLQRLFRENKVSVKRDNEDRTQAYKVIIDDKVKLSIRKDRVTCDNGGPEEVAAMARIVKELGWTTVRMKGPPEFRKLAYVALLAVGYEPEDIEGYEPVAMEKPKAKPLPHTIPWKRGRP